MAFFVPHKYLMLHLTLYSFCTRVSVSACAYGKLVFTVSVLCMKIFLKISFQTSFQYFHVMAVNVIRRFLVKPSADCYTCCRPTCSLARSSFTESAVWEDALFWLKTQFFGRRSGFLRRVPSHSRSRTWRWNPCLINLKQLVPWLIPLVSPTGIGRGSFFDFDIRSLSIR